mgnify:CR=1 FL=1
MGVLGLLVVGIAAGFIASRVLKTDLSLAQTIAIGVIGAIVGGVVLRVLVATMGLAAGFVGAVLGAILVLWLFNRYTG